MAKEKTEKEITCLSEYIEDAAKKKKKSVAEWWDGIMQNIPKCQMASHVGKFTHPGISGVSLWNQEKEKSSGYISTATVPCDLDLLVSSASYLGAVYLLIQPVRKEGKTVLADLETGGAETEKELAKLHLNIAPLKAGYAAMMEGSWALPKESDGRLKQVYFPTGEDSYHLLSLLTASGLLAEVKKRIWAWNGHARNARNAKSELYGEDNCEIKDLVQISFGGANPQNISGMNTRQNGKFFLVRSMPPFLQKGVLRLPKKDFFLNTMYYRSYEFTFRRLHVLFQLDRNNREIRQMIRDSVMDLVDAAIMRASLLQQKDGGWSEGCALPVSQKIWLDAMYEEERAEGEWVEEVSLAFGRWLLRSYERILGKEKILLGDGELRFFRNQMEKVLKEEVRGE